MKYCYTVPQSVDASLAGVPAKLVLLFKEGSALEVTIDDITHISNATPAVSSSYISLEYGDRKRHCDCYGEVQGASAFSLVCYDAQDDTLLPNTDPPLTTWPEVLQYALNTHSPHIELIDAIHKG
jgi:hypothetical protein